MPATVALVQSTGAGETPQVGCARMDFFGALDVANPTSDVTTTRDNNKITKPSSGTTHSAENWFRLRETSGTGFVQLNNFKFWGPATYDTGYSGFTSANESPIGDPSYVTPVLTDSTVAVQTIPTAAPAGKNVQTKTDSGDGNPIIPGDTTRQTGYVVVQLDVSSAATAGTNFQLHWRYEEST